MLWQGPKHAVAVQVPFGQVPDVVGEAPQHVGVVAGEHHGGPAVAGGLDLLHGELDARGVERVGGLVQDEHLGPLHHGGGQT